ncbi:thiol reductant ABC exporter subunit CydD [Insolitispirillum peregrinum]|uniref:ATP-binding cassette, subfamily C, CydD n=1 Tax=Insolitispirillum peregrinum TaxID=80876 RepID=A0A1N7LAR6_9PROT|nr:thiol reductant ABC exporter subunit CydD [Insolitispirillum peregrinum]SIS70861.1 ATP-binding cassette, subfamily C, CydD [Insolitispirillum peregrinum]
MTKTADTSSLIRTAGRTAGRLMPLALTARAVQGLTGLAAAWIMADIITMVVFARADLAACQSRIAALAGLFLLRLVLGQLTEHLTLRAGSAIRRHLFARLLDHALRLGPVRLADTSPGEMAAVHLDAVAGTEAYWRRWLPARAPVMVLPPVILAITLPLDWQTAGILALSLPLMPLFLILAGKAAQKANQRQWATLLRLGGHLLEALRGLPDLKVLRASQRMVEAVGAMAEAYRRDTMSVLRKAFLSALVLEFFASVSVALVAVLIGFRLLDGSLDFHTGFFLLLLAPEFYTPLRLMGTQRHARMEATAAAEKISAFLARPVPEVSAVATPVPAWQTLRLENVTVRYGSGRTALNGLSLTIRAGEHVAIVGESGAGKTTLFGLLCGFITPDSGGIFLDDQPLSSLSLTDWRQQVTHLAQRSHLPHGTVADAIAMGRALTASGAPDPARLHAAIHDAEAEAFIARLPHGVQTVIGDGGHGLSGGEAQRMALARAFYAPGPLVLCDEPTAHLDPATEQAITLALHRLRQGRTMLTIAHRLSTVRDADRIVVLSAGQVIEDGPHEALLAQGGTYARMVATRKGEQTTLKGEQK